MTQRFTVHYQHGTNTYRINDAVLDINIRPRYLHRAYAQRIADAMNRDLLPWTPPLFCSPSSPPAAR